MKENQIKGGKQLTDPAEIVDFLSETFHESEADRKLKKVTINSSRGQVSVFLGDLNKNASTSRRAGTALSQEVSETVKEEMNIEILPNNLGRSHRVGNPELKKNGRLIIDKFVKYNVRHHIFKNRKLLKVNGVSITESLTKYCKTKQSKRNLRL